jgi:hypothetical protein
MVSGLHAFIRSSIFMQMCYILSHSCYPFSCIQVENVKDELREQLKRLENGEVCLLMAHQFDPAIHIFHWNQLLDLDCIHRTNSCQADLFSTTYIEK